jgi:hypothetical protein
VLITAAEKRMLRKSSVVEQSFECTELAWCYCFLLLTAVGCWWWWWWHGLLLQAEQEVAVSSAAQWCNITSIQEWAWCFATLWCDALSKVLCDTNTHKESSTAISNTEVYSVLQALYASIQRDIEPVQHTKTTCIHALKWEKKNDD